MRVQLNQNDSRKRKQVSPQQTLQILNGWECTDNGMDVGQKYQTHPRTLYRWEKAMEQGAQVFLRAKDLAPIPGSAHWRRKSKS